MNSKIYTHKLSDFEAGIVTNGWERERIYEIRMNVFVEEQQVPAEEELDAYDETAIHFFVRTKSDNSDHFSMGSAFVGTARFIDKGEGVGKIGRVAILKEYRGVGLGALLMRFIEMEAVRLEYSKLILEAQVYAIPFYEKLGYVAEGETFLDANIEHRLMMKEVAVL